ncbi:MAG: DUF438 domain-containing protein [Bacillota bacterium]
MIEMTEDTTLAEALKEYPGLLDVLTDLSPNYGLLRNATIRSLMAPRTSMADVAKRGGLSFDDLAIRLAEHESRLRLGDRGVPEQQDKIKEQLKDLIRGLKGTEDVGPVKARFKELLRRVDPVVIAAAEAELTQEGYTMQDLMNACDVHLELFRENLDQNKLDIPREHPLWRQVKDQEAILFWLNRVQELLGAARRAGSYEAAAGAFRELRAIVAKLREAENHDVRQENTLFPVLERYGIEEPPAVMWEEHSRMKDTRRELQKLIEAPPAGQGGQGGAGGPAGQPFSDHIGRLAGLAIGLSESFVQHVTKEQGVLYQIALRMLSDEDWQEVKRESDELGYFELPPEVLGEERGGHDGQ